MWDLPISVEIDGEIYRIRNRCDYRIILDVICALNDNELTNEEKLQCALYIFYEDLSGCKNVKQAIEKMFSIISYDEEEREETQNKPKLMDWNHDFKQIAPAISKVLGYEVRDADRYIHWYTFIGGYMEISRESVFSMIVSIRFKKNKGKKLEKHEQEFYLENRKIIDLPVDLTEDEKKWLESD